MSLQRCKCVSSIPLRLPAQYLRTGACKRGGVDLKYLAKLLKQHIYEL
jgi:hypothetical protein